VKPARNPLLTSAAFLILSLQAACAPEARRVLVLDLNMTDAALLAATARPWRRAGFTVEYRRFYPHLARSDFTRYRTLLFLLGREPEGASDAMTSGDVSLLHAWVTRGGALVLGYAVDSVGTLDRSTVNQWLAWEGAGISISDHMLRDTTPRGGSPRPQPWVEGRRLGDDPLGSVYEQFPLDRNGVLDVERRLAVIAVGSGRAWVQGPKGRITSPNAPVMAASRIGDGIVVVLSRTALGALGPQDVATTMPVLQRDALEDTERFLVAFARWIRRPAEWAHVPPAQRHGRAVLPGPQFAAELEPAASVPPGMSDAVPLSAGEIDTTHPVGVPSWIRETGIRALWTALLVPRGPTSPATPRSAASLDSLVESLDEAGYNLLAGDAEAGVVADSMHHLWDERAAVRKAWRDAVNVLQPTSVAWIPAVDYRRLLRAGATGSTAASGPAPACQLDSLFGEVRLTAELVTLARLAAGLRQLIPAVAIDLDSMPSVRVSGTTVGAEFCDDAWHQVLPRLGSPVRDSILLPDRLRTLRDAGLLDNYYRALEDQVAEEASALRDKVLKERPGLFFAFRAAHAPGDWLSIGLMRGFTLPERPLLLFTPEAVTHELLAAYRARGINAVHATELSPVMTRGHSVTGLKQVVFEENDGFWVAGGGGARAPGQKSMANDTLSQVLRHLSR